jgi:hypothetical protein
MMLCILEHVFCVVREPFLAYNCQAPEEDSYLLDYYNSLQYTLYETAHPETVDRTSVPRGHSNKEQVNVVLLSSPVECIGVLLEGNVVAE